MLSVDYNKKIFLMDGTKIDIDISIPISYAKDIDIKDKNFVEEIIVSQIIGGIKNAIKDYQQSELPDIFIRNQYFCVTNKLNMGIYGMFLCNDDIIVDADAISNIRRVKSAYIFRPRSRT